LGESYTTTHRNLRLHARRIAGGNESGARRLFDLEDGEALPANTLVLDETPSNPTRVILAVARFPKAAVCSPEGDDEWPAICSG
jgi:hypothetical protein